MRNTIRNISKVHHELMTNRAERVQATKVAIYRLKRNGQRYVEPSTYSTPERLQETLDRLHSLNPGLRFEAA